jgi:hypothetical protein
MPADQPYKAKIIERQVRDGDAVFKVKMYLNPSKQSEDVIEEIIKTFGNQIIKGKRCLDIDEDFVRQGIDDDEYTGLIYVKNKELQDVATGSFQVYDWCETGKPQFWINDLCRVTEIEPRPAPSPVRTLLKVLERLAFPKFKSVYLMVDKEEVEKGKLPELYREKYNFTEDATCVFDDAIAMKKTTTRGASRTYTRKNPTHRNR